MIDFHCHLDLFPFPERTADELDRSGTYVLSVTNTPKAFPKTAQLSKSRRRIRTALGLHPQLVAERHGEVGLFRHLLSETRYVGEVGIDGGTEHSRHMKLQREVFDEILDACSKIGGRVLSIHSRHATGEVLESLERRRDAGLPVLHWFSGPLSHADRAVDLGAWFSVGLPMLKGRRAASLIGRIPRERVLTESDAPFTSAPQGAYPMAAMKDAVSVLSRLWGCDEAQTRQQLRSNLRVLGSIAAAYKPRTGVP